jgi:hypothetical protein
MKIFLSHAHEQAKLADGLAIALRQEGHAVFLDTDALKAAEGFHEAIRREIQASDLFVFLVSENSLEAGSYALTEMATARERWRNPTGHVLPVVVGTVDFDRIPPYLKAVTVLQPKGDPVAETLARVAALQRSRSGRRLAIAAGIAAVLAAVGLGVWQSRRDSQDAAACLLRAQVTQAASGGAPVTTLDAGPVGALKAFVVIAGVASLDIERLTGPQSRWIIDASGPTGDVLAHFELAGCPSAPREFQDDATGVRLRLAPRR